MIKTIASMLGGSGLSWVAGASALAAAGAIGVQTLRLASVKTALASEQRDRKDERARRAEAALRATAAAKAEGDRRVAALQGIIDVNQPKLDAALYAAGRVPDLDRRVRDATAALWACRRAGPADPTSASAGAPADETARVLAELQRESQEAERARTRYADQAAAAGETCQLSYDALNLTPGPAVTGSE